MILSVVRMITNKLFFKVWKLESLGLYDRIMLIDSPNNSLNVIGACRFEKFDADKM